MANSLKEKELFKLEQTYCSYSNNIGFGEKYLNGISVFNFPQLQRTSGCCKGLRIRWLETDRGNRWNSETYVE